MEIIHCQIFLNIFFQETVVRTVLSDVRDLHGKRRGVRCRVVRKQIDRSLPKSLFCGQMYRHGKCVGLIVKRIGSGNRSLCIFARILIRSVRKGTDSHKARVILLDSNFHDLILPVSADQGQYAIFIRVENSDSVEFLGVLFLQKYQISWAGERCSRFPRNEQPFLCKECSP